MMKMLSYLVTESESLKIGKRQKKNIYLYICYRHFLQYISWGPGADVRDMFGSKGGKRTSDVSKSPVSQPTYSAFVFVLEKPNTQRPGELI